MRIEADDIKKERQEEQLTYTPVKNEKRTIGSEIAKMRSLGFRKGWEYFWEYYRNTILVILAAIVMVVSLVNTVIKNSRPYIVNVHVFNNVLTEGADPDVLSQEFADYMELNLEDYQMTMDLTEYLDFSGGGESSYNMMQKVMAMVAAREMDVFGGDTSFVNFYAVGEPDSVLYADLAEILPSDFFQFLKEQDRILYKNYLTADGAKAEEYAAAIDVSDTRLVNDNYLLVSPCYLGVAVNSERQETAIEFLKWIFDFQS